MPPSFDQFGTIAASPAVVSVPHAGREYPAGLDPLLAVPPVRLVGLEDRSVDRLLGDIRAAGHLAIVARAPRLLIDLNRAEDECDAAMLPPGACPTRAVSPRARGGLGLVPTRLAGVGDIWRVLPGHQEVEARLTAIHRPYHAALGQALAAARDRWGFAVLIDLHSMPSLPGPRAAQIVFGDRHGTTAAAAVVAAAETAAAHAGYRTGRNAPYAGGHIVTRHGRPSTDVHALQIEIDRRCYLDATLLRTTPAHVRVAAMLADAVDRTIDALSVPQALAAE